MMDEMSPAGMAARLVRRHSDIGFIRSYVLSHYGHAPARDKIMEMRAEYEREQRQLKEAARIAQKRKFRCGHPETDDNTIEREDGNASCLICQRAKDAAAEKRERERNALDAKRRKTKNKPSLWPAWYRAADKPTISGITARASELSGWDVSAIQGQSRAYGILHARLAVYLVAQEAGFSTTQIGRSLGYRDHSSVVSGCKRAREIAKRDQDFALLIHRLRDHVASGHKAMAA